MKVRIFDDKVTLGKAAAAAGAEKIRAALRNRGRANIILATGASQFEMLAALLEVDGASVLYPFVLRPIDGSHLKDITSPYGYGGPLFWGTDDASGLSALFWERFDEWARENDVVSEFMGETVIGEETR